MFSIVDALNKLISDGIQDKQAYTENHMTGGSCDEVLSKNVSLFFAIAGRRKEKLA